MAVELSTSFNPPWYLKGSTLQTVLSSMKLRAMGPNPMLDACREIVLTVGHGIRLQGFLSLNPEPSPRGLVILLHGWEGSAESTYILHTGRFLFSQGYDVFRLNLRDHGRTHHLNEGLFYCTLLDEVFEAVTQASRMGRGGPVLLAGFSLGGNFALRIARRLGKGSVPVLSHVMAISPVVDPFRATDAIDADLLLRRYFMHKWKRSLKKKQELFPHAYDFSRLLSLKTIMGMTEALIEQSGLYADVGEYFGGYTLTGDALADVAVPLTVVASRDDHAIPVDDFFRLTLAPGARLVIHHYGGHNGFLYGILLPSWYELEMLGLLGRISGSMPDRE